MISGRKVTLKKWEYFHISASYWFIRRKSNIWQPENMMYDNFLMHKMTLPENSRCEDVTYVISLLASYLTSQMLPKDFLTKAATICARLWSMEFWSSTALAELLSACLPISTKGTERNKNPVQLCLSSAFLYGLQTKFQNCGNLSLFCSQRNEILEDFFIIFSARYHKFWIYFKE